jgi:tetratricopeptide (TPR) repeat protein
LVESSIIGLELVFEHRNYLPAMFLFFPIAAELKRLLDFYRARSQAMFAVLTVSTGLLVVGLGMGTYVRNQIWSSGQLLWEDAASKAPASSRPLHNLAWVHFERIGDYRSALELYRLALQGTKTNSFQESIILNNIASIYYAQKSYKQSVDYWSKALESYPGYAEAAYRLSLALMHSGDLAGAEYRIDSLLSDYARHPAALNLKGILLLQRGKAAESIRFFTPSLKARSTQSTALINIGSAFIALGEMQKAARFFRAAAFSSPSDKTAMLWMAALEAQKGNTAEADRWINSLLKSMKVADLSAWMTGDAVVRLQRDSILLPDRTPEFVDAMFSCIRRALHNSEMKSLVSAFPSVETEDERFLSLFGR